MSEFRRFLIDGRKTTPYAYNTLIFVIGLCGVVNVSAAIKLLADSGVIEGVFVPIVTIGSGLVTGIVGLRIAYFFWKTGLLKEFDDWIRKVFRRPFQRP